MINTRTLRRVYVPKLEALLSGVVVSLLPWGTHKPATRITEDTRVHYSGNFGNTGQNMKPYGELTTQEHDQIGAFFGGHYG